MQFTLSRLLASTALIAVGLAGATLPWRVSNADFVSWSDFVQGLVLTHLWSSGAIFGAGVGLLFRHPWPGAILGFVAFVGLVISFG